MFCIVAEVFGNIKNGISAHNWVFMTGLWNDLASLWLVLGDLVS